MEKKLMQKNQIARVHYEINLLKRFSHPNIIKYWEFFETDETIYIVQERAGGFELYDAIDARRKKKKIWDEWEIASIIQ